MGYKISLAGDLGSGKSTVSLILIDRLGLEYYGTGKICRRVAIEMGLDIADMNVYMETHPEVDKMIDDGLVALSDDPRNLIIDSRMAWHFTRDTFTQSKRLTQFLFMLKYDYNKKRKRKRLYEY